MSSNKNSSFPSTLSSLAVLVCDGTAVGNLCRDYLMMVPPNRITWGNSGAGGASGDNTSGVVANTTNWNAQCRVAAVLLEHPHAQNFSPAQAYQSAWLKHYLASCEAAGEEDIHDGLYEYAGALCRSGGGGAGNRSSADTGHDSKRTCFKTYFLPHHPRRTDGSADGAAASSWACFTLEETREYISAGTTGLCVWPAAMYLADWASRQELAAGGVIFKDRSVLELGAGCGLVGLAVSALTEAKHVTLSDCHGQVLQLLERNVDLNNGVIQPLQQDESAASTAAAASASAEAVVVAAAEASNGRTDDGEHSHDGTIGSHGEVGSNPQTSASQSRISLLDLDWRDVTAEALAPLRGSLVLGADIVYDLDIIPALVRVLSILLLDQRVETAANPPHGSGGEAFIASTLRNPATLSAFVDALKAAGLCVKEHACLKAESPRSGLVYDTSAPVVLHRIVAPWPVSS